jgi:enoyl-CoA hydratase
MSTGEVVAERAGDQPIGLVRINRPAVHNALNRGVIAGLLAAVEGFAGDGSTRAVIITGTGERSFCAGADLGELAGLGQDDALDVLRRGQRAFRRIEKSPIPVIAAVNGLALGGGFELVLCCSFALLSEQAQLGLPEAGLGLVPGYGGTQRLTRAAGPAWARFVMLTGRRITAGQAYQLGLTPLPPLPSAELLPAALELAGDICARGPAACQTILGLTGRALDWPLDDGLAAESARAALAVAGPEAAEGIAAFQQKRPADFGAPGRGVAR